MPLYNSSSSPPPAYDAQYGSSASGKQPKTSTPPPHTNSSPTGSHSNMFPSGQWRDLWAALLFYLHLSAVGAFAAYSVWYLSQHQPVAVDPVEVSRSNVIITVAVVLGSCLSSALIAIGVLNVTKRAPEAAIKAAFFANILLGFVLFVMIVLSGAGMASVLALLMAGLSLVMYFIYRKHIPLSASILKAVIEVLGEYPAMMNVTAVSVIAQILYFMVIGVCLVGVQQLVTRHNWNQQSISAVVVGLVFSLFWTSQVIQNVSLTTIAGVYATVYFQPTNRVPNPTSKSLGRAMTWSFGSICFGSMVVAILQTIRYLVNKSRDGNDLAGAIVDCLLRIVEDLTKYFNYYAFIHVAIYGKPYIESAKTVWTLLKRNGVLSIINDNIIGTFCGMASMAISCFTAIFTFVSLWWFVNDTTTAVVAAYISLLLGALCSYLVFEVIQSGATTTMVCLAEDPNAVQRSKPELYSKLSSAYSSIFYNWRYP